MRRGSNQEIVHTPSEYYELVECFIISSVKFEILKSWHPTFRGLAATNSHHGVEEVVSTAASLRLGYPTIGAQPYDSLLFQGTATPSFDNG